MGNGIYFKIAGWVDQCRTFAEYSCPIRLRGARYLYLNVAVEKRNISAKGSQISEKY
jgi:hypothetical protein